MQPPRRGDGSKYARNMSLVAIQREMARLSKSGIKDEWTKERVFELWHEIELRETGLVPADGESKDWSAEQEGQ